MEEIRKIITEIENKVVRMKTTLATMEVKNQKLEEELNLIQNKLELRIREANDFKEKYDNLKQQNEQRVESASGEDKDVQIDALVREIDECINRLKV